ncbi:hypothetical protein DNK47_02285 [Mycoplasma wenyonii]|uniref:Uncharacterized protein n=1 Tax=Mycoplasma wenyonii TaxID=65123 RepID=A0A328PV24_9MOLU|nr:hypothetical protein [Mycoplasma wenyonii]RAO94949.1 hypothetical protein DNK47_02285 [Mycoplasma wenyonii]
MAIALSLLGKIAIAGAIGVATVTPITYLAVNGSFNSLRGGDRSSVEVKYESICRHLPLKNNELETRLWVCTGGQEDKPVFKWWEKGSTSEGTTKDIETLSWKKKTDSSNAFELQMKLKGQDGRSIQEGGDTNYFPSAEIEKLEENCSFKRYVSNLFELQCKDTTNTQEGRPHTLSTHEIRN